MTARRAVSRTVVVGLGLLLLSACATETTPEFMSVSAGGAASPAPGSRADHSFRVGGVTGGGDTNALGLSDVSSDVLKAALTTSLRNLGYIAADDSKAAYVVSADLVDLDRPVAALDPALLFVPIDLSVTAKIRYTVTPARGGPPVFSEVVATTGTATASDAATPAGRVRKANEAAIRLNTVAFLKRLDTDWK